MTQQYSDYLFPKPHYQLIAFGNKYGVQPNHFLARHTKNEDIKDDFGNLRSDCVAFQTDYLHDYSTNLLGIFQLYDLQWKWLKGTVCGELWNEGEVGLMPILERDVTLVIGREAFYLKTQDLHQQFFDLPSPVESAAQVECRVLHTPTKGNFWHFSLRWVIRGEDTTNWEKKQRRKALETARSVIIGKAFFEKPIFESVPPNYYDTF